MAPYVAKILKGAKPGDLPIEIVNRYELVFNLNATRGTGVTIPPDLVKQADKVVD